MAGDAENFTVAATPGGIEAQERAGQGRLVASEALPKECPRAELEAMGVVFGEDVDDLFINATLPPGWKKERTDHAMWSNLLDEQGRKRGAIFYKAAFYDRRADMHLCRAINVTRRYGDNDSVDVAVVRGDEVLFVTERIDGSVRERAYFDATDAAEKQAREWADEHYPDWRNPLAYWE
jgi:hypothetical protein